MYVVADQHPSDLAEPRRAENPHVDLKWCLSPSNVNEKASGLRIWNVRKQPNPQGEWSSEMVPCGSTDKLIRDAGIDKNAWHVMRLYGFDGSMG